MSEVKKISIAAVLSILLSMFFLSQSVSLPESARFLPRIFVTVVTVLSIAMVFETYYKVKKNVKVKRRIDERSEEDDDPEEKQEVINYKTAFIFALFIAAYIFAIQSIGYLIVTPIFIIVAYRFLRSTSWRNTILISAGLTLFVYGLFIAFLRLPVPMGLLK